MKMETVISSNIASIGFDEHNDTLYVAFNTGSLYSYANVSENIFHGLVSAPSPGTYPPRKRG